MATVYEGMFLLDNQVVRGEDWKQAKSLVTATLEKHGGKVLTARRWDERRLAYPIKGKKRATYLLTYYELPGDAMAATRRDFDLSESVLRYLWLAVDEVPEEERGLAEAENADDFRVPEPPDDDHVEEPEEPEEAPRGRDRRGDSAEGEAKGDDAKAADAKAAEGDEKAADAKAEGGDAKPEGEAKAAEAAEASTATETPAESKQEGADAPKEN